MALISIQIPDDKLNMVVGHIGVALNYQTNVAGPNNTTIPNPETRGQFIRKHMAQYAKALAVRGARMDAERVAGDAAQSTINAINIS